MSSSVLAHEMAARVELGDLRVVVCDDEKNMRNLLTDVLMDDGWVVLPCANGEDAVRGIAVADPPYPVLIVDLSMPGMDGFEVIRQVRDGGSDISIIVITAFGTVEAAVRAMQAGASDFIVKPFDNTRIRAAARRALATRDLLTQVELSQPYIEAKSFLGPDKEPLPIVGQDKRLKSVFDLVRKIADLKTSVLICGDSGTGKELVAQAIHFNGSRRDKPFVAVNCAALPESLLESEFFGHERGAFTGAFALQRGKFELADGGTLFLDEIGEMPLGLQVKLLRVLQEQKFARVGGEKEIKVDVRVIAATNKDLSEGVRNKSFREDLFYRLNVIPIQLPALRERSEDIPQLIRFFSRRFCERHKLPVIEFSDAILREAKLRTWPGNIRELQNAVEKAVILQDPRVLLAPVESLVARTPQPETLPQEESLLIPNGLDQPPQTPWPMLEDDGLQVVGENDLVIKLGEDGEVRDLGDVAAEAQRGALIRALRICGGNKAEAAKRLGVSYKTLFNKIHELGISISTKVE